MLSTQGVDLIVETPLDHHHQYHHHNHHLHHNHHSPPSHHLNNQLLYQNFETYFDLSQTEPTFLDDTATFTITDSSSSTKQQTDSTMSGSAQLSASPAPFLTNGFVGGALVTGSDSLSPSINGNGPLHNHQLWSHSVSFTHFFTFGELSDFFRILSTVSVQLQLMAQMVHLLQHLRQ